MLFGRSAVTHCIKFDLDGLMRGNMAARAAFNASGLQNGYLNRNEVRVDEGRNPVSDPKMDEYTIQLNMQPVSQLGVEP